MNNLWKCAHEFIIISWWCSIKTVSCICIKVSKAGNAKAGNVPIGNKRNRILQINWNSACVGLPKE